ncbi:LamG-like jellyroll fold domain-containing protein [Nocardiopsis rhodophaea]|uniref:LamG-like jellyroll fold domain-containing protein n=1 Tax=Nocardiopsis rhodophaea TaxID=280238 RepID=UPI0031D8D645
MLDRAGKQLQIDWPHELPEPRIEGTEATYENVLPDVDLVVRATVDGVSHVLVVHSAEAASNEDLADLRLVLQTQGVEVRERDEGGIEAVDEAAGGAVFEAPVPLMWDSGETGDDDGSQSERRSAAVAAPNLLNGPAESSRMSEIDVRLSEDELHLTPDADMLSSAETTYPVYIDPVWKTSTRSGWAMVSSGYSNQSYWKFSGKSSEGVGRCPNLAGDYYECRGVRTKRLFYRIPTGAYHDKQILSAEFAVTMRHAYDSSAHAVRLYLTGRINSSTSWNNQPSWADRLDTKSPKNSASSCTRTNQNVRFDAKSAVTKAASRDWSTATFGLRSANESDYKHWKRFCDNAQLEVRYNTTPDLPRQSDIDLVPGGECIGGTDRPYVDQPPRVSVYLRDPDHSRSHVEKVRAQFRVFWTDKSGDKQRRDFTTSYKAANSRFYYQVPDDIPQNTVIGLIVRAHDGTAWSDWSWKGAQTRCQFIYDAASPDEPTVNSYDYPADDAWHTGVGTYGDFTLSSSSDDVVAYRYGINQPPSKQNTLEPKETGGDVTLAFVPEHDGPHSLYVEAVDAAGRVSTRATHLFLVSPGRRAAPHWPMDDASGATEARDTGGQDREYYSATPAVAGSSVTFGADGPGTTGGSAAEFDGSVDSYMVSRNARVGTTRSSFSLSIWARVDDLDRDQTILSQTAAGSVKYELGYCVEKGEWCFTVPEYGEDSDGDYGIVDEWDLYSGVDPRAGEWNHITLVYDERRNNVKFYVDGRWTRTGSIGSDLVARPGPSFPWPRRPVAAPMVYTTEASIGRTVGRDGTASDHLDGALADLRAFSRLLQPEEIRELHALPVERRAYWQLNESVDVTSPEADGGAAMNLAGDARVRVPEPSQGETALVGAGHLELDGDGDYASAPGMSAPTGGSFTVAVRARLAAARPARSMTVLSQPGEQQSAFDLQYSAEDDRWEVVLAASDTETTEFTSVVHETAAPNSERRGDHLAVVYDAFDREVRLYVNGQLAQTSTARLDQPWAASGPVTIGRALTDSAWASDYSGAVDDVRVYEGAAGAELVRRLASTREHPDI